MDSQFNPVSHNSYPHCFLQILNNTNPAINLHRAPMHVYSKWTGALLQEFDVHGRSNVDRADESECREAQGRASDRVRMSFYENPGSGD